MLPERPVLPASCARVNLVAGSVLVVGWPFLMSRQTALCPTVAGPAAEVVPRWLALAAIVVAMKKLSRSCAAATLRVNRPRKKAHRPE